MKTTVTQFLAGKPIWYHGLDEKIYAARVMRHAGITFLRLTEEYGKIIREPLMPENELRTFFNGVKPFLESTK
jgi:hypothetical protein